MGGGTHKQGSISGQISNLLGQKRSGMARRSSISSGGNYGLITVWPSNSLNHSLIGCRKVSLSCIVQWSKDVSRSYPLTQRIEIKVHTGLWKEQQNFIQRNPIEWVRPSERDASGSPIIVWGFPLWESREDHLLIGHREGDSLFWLTHWVIIRNSIQVKSQAAKLCLMPCLLIGVCWS